MSKYIFPCLLMALDLGAVVTYFFGGDTKTAIYWIDAAVLNCCVTF